MYVLCVRLIVFCVMRIVGGCDWLYCVGVCGDSGVGEKGGGQLVYERWGE